MRCSILNWSSAGLFSSPNKAFFVVGIFSLLSFDLISALSLLNLWQCIRTCSTVSSSSHPCRQQLLKDLSILLVHRRRPLWPLLNLNSARVTILSLCINHGRGPKVLLSAIQSWQTYLVRSSAIWVFHAIWNFAISLAGVRAFEILPQDGVVRPSLASLSATVLPSMFTWLGIQHRVIFVPEAL